MDEQGRLDLVVGRFREPFRLGHERRQQGFVVARRGGDVADPAPGLRRLRERAQVEADHGPLDPGAGLGQGDVERGSGGRHRGGRYPIVIRLALPPAAAVLTLSARSTTSRSSGDAGLAGAQPCTPTIGPARAASAWFDRDAAPRRRRGAAPRRSRGRRRRQSAPARSRVAHGDGQPRAAASARGRPASTARAADGQHRGQLREPVGRRRRPGTARPRAAAAL